MLPVSVCVFTNRQKNRHKSVFSIFSKEMVTHSSILAWRIPWTEEPGRLQSTGSQRVRHDWATSLHFTSHGKELEFIKVHSEIWIKKYFGPLWPFSFRKIWSKPIEQYCQCKPLDTRKNRWISKKSMVELESKTGKSASNRKNKKALGIWTNATTVLDWRKMREI